MYSVASRWLHRNSLHEAVFLALTVVFGLQVLRVLLTGLVFHVRESLDAGSFVPGAYALVLFLLAFLAAPMFRALGHKRALVFTAGGLALVRLLEQLVPWPVVDLGLTTLGTALFLLFIPTYIGHLRGHRVEGGHTFATGLLLGIGADTAIKGIFATLDLSWQPGVVAHVVVILLVGCHLLLLRSVTKEESSEATSSTEISTVVPLVAIGPILFLEFLLFQNIGQQTTLINWNQLLVYLWVVIANAVGMAVALGVMSRPGFSGQLSSLALGGLFALLVTGERSGVLAAVIVLYGQVVLSMSVGMIGIALGVGSNREGIAHKPGIGDITGACGLGMLLFLVLNFVYYVNYEFDIPGGSAVIAPIAVIILLLTVPGTMLISSGYRARMHTLRPGLAQDWTPIVLSILLLVLPLAYLAAWDEPQPASASEGFPIRVMSYNLHQGFDVDGYLAIEELADTIEDQDPDIIALQEVSRGWVIDGSFDMLVWLSRRLDMPYVWGPTADSVWGSAILSRYPILDARNEPMPNNSQLQLKRGLIVSRIDIGDDEPLTVIATHLHHLADEGHLREPQVRAVLKAWNNDDRSVLIGDFNALPDAPEMLLLEDAGLKDAFCRPRSKDPAGGRRSTSEQGASGRGVGHGHTWPSDNPSKRIDYIWVSSDLETSDFSMTYNLASDHFGVAVTLAK